MAGSHGTGNDNFLAALEWSHASSSPEGAGAGLRLVGALCWFWQVRGYLSEGRKQAARVLASDTGKNALARTKTLNGAGNLAWGQGDYKAARALHMESLQIQRELGDRRGVGNSLNNLGLVIMDQGDYGSARPFLEEALVIRRESGDWGGIAMALNNMGMLTLRQGDYAPARRLYEEGLTGYTELGDRRGIAVSWNNLGMVTYEQKDYMSSRSFFEKSLVLQQEVGDQGSIANALNNLGSVAYQQRECAYARTLYKESLVVYRQIADRQGMVIALGGLAALSAATGAALVAAYLWGAEERLREEIGAPRPSSDLPRHEPQVADARAALGDAAKRRSNRRGRELKNAAGFVTRACDEGTR